MGHWVCAWNATAKCLSHVGGPGGVNLFSYRDFMYGYLFPYISSYKEKRGGTGNLRGKQQQRQWVRWVAHAVAPGPPWVTCPGGPGPVLI
jgi:hypothetical protein